MLQSFDHMTDVARQVRQKNYTVNAAALMVTSADICSQ